MFIIVKDFKFPDVGEGIHEGTIVKWHVKEGDTVKADATILEVETDKAIVELPSPASGKILKINFKEGDKVTVGNVLVSIGEEGEKADKQVRDEAKPAPEKTGQAPSKEERAPIPEKTIPAPVKEEKMAEPAKPVSVPGQAKGPEKGRVLATPATRGLARELGVDIHTVRGTGPAGRVTSEDVKNSSASGGITVAPGRMAPARAVSAGIPPVPKEEGDTRVPLTHLRKVIAERMVYSKTHIPHACGMDFLDVTRLSEVRQKEKEAFAKKGIKLTFLPFIMKACAVALREKPEFNAHFDENAGELVLRKKINIGFAVDTEEGLMVPVIRDIERKSMIEIAKDIESLAEQARTRKIKLEDISGSTFTITNVGSVGGMYSTPIINPPEIAIMGVHRIKDLPLVIDGKIIARKVMGISMCFDHRVADGAAATHFMNIVKKHLEDPDLLLVDIA